MQTTGKPESIQKDEKTLFTYTVYKPGNEDEPRNTLNTRNANRIFQTVFIFALKQHGSELYGCVLECGSPDSLLRKIHPHTEDQKLPLIWQKTQKKEGVPRFRGAPLHLMRMHDDEECL